MSIQESTRADGAPTVTVPAAIAGRVRAAAIAEYGFAAEEAYGIADATTPDGDRLNLVDARVRLISDVLQTLAFVTPAVERDIHLSAPGWLHGKLAAGAIEALVDPVRNNETEITPAVLRDVATSLDLLNTYRAAAQGATR